MPTPAAAPDRTPRPRLRAVLALAVAAALVVWLLDQATKLWVERTMELGETIPVIDGILQWHYILNPGAAFSLGEDFTWLFTAIMAAVSLGIAIYLPRVRSLPWALALGLVLGGALGNLTDRVLRWPGFPSGHVVDFIHVNRFAVFNIADSGVVVGVAAVALLILLGRDPDGIRSTGTGSTGSDGTEPVATDPRPDPDPDADADPGGDSGGSSESPEDRPVRGPWESTR